MVTVMNRINSLINVLKSLTVLLMYGTIHYSRYVGSQRLSEMLQQPYDLYKGGWADTYLLGLVNQVNSLKAERCPFSVCIEILRYAMQTTLIFYSLIFL